ncbi:zinc finger domain-containing protein [Citrobacter freundii]
MQRCWQRRRKVRQGQLSSSYCSQCFLSSVF